MNKSGLFGEILEQGKSTLGDTGRAVKGQLSGFGKATVNQISPNLLGKTQQPSEEEALGQKAENEAGDVPKDENAEKAAKAHAKEMVKHLYGINDEKKDEKGKKPIKQGEQPEKKKILSEEEKIQQLRSSLHQEYYHDLTKPLQQQEEERPAEKVEKEKEMEDLEEQDKEKKKPSPLVARAQQKTEKFPGASG
jgi:hypothetical protein